MGPYVFMTYGKSFYFVFGVREVNVSSFCILSTSTSVRDRRVEQFTLLTVCHVQDGPL